GHSRVGDRYERVELRLRLVAVVTAGHHDAARSDVQADSAYLVDLGNYFIHRWCFVSHCSSSLNQTMRHRHSAGSGSDRFDGSRSPPLPALCRRMSPCQVGRFREFKKKNFSHERMRIFTKEGQENVSQKTQRNFPLEGETHSTFQR